MYAPDSSGGGSSSSLPPDILKALLAMSMGPKGPQGPPESSGWNFGDEASKYLGGGGGADASFKDFMDTISGRNQPPIPPSIAAPDGSDPYTGPPVAGNHPSGGGGNSQSDNLMDALFQQLMGSVGDTSSSSVDYQSLLADQEQAIRGAYGGEIGALRGQNRRTTNEADASKKEIGNMYEALGRSYEKTAAKEDRQTKHETTWLKNLGDQTSKQIEHGGQRGIDAQAQMLKKLGVEDAAGSVLKPQQKQVIKQIANTQKQSNQDVGFTKRMGVSQSNFLTRGADMSRLAGANAKTDIIQQLGDILAGNRDQIAGLKGQRDMDVANAKTTLMSTAAANESAASDAQFQQLMDLAGLRMQMEGQQQSAQMDQAQLFLDRRSQHFDEQQAINDAAASNAPSGSDPSGLNDLLPGNLGNAYSILDGLKNNKQQAGGYDALKQFLASPEMQTGKIKSLGNDGTLLSMTPSAAAEQAGHIAEQMGLPPSVVERVKLAAFTAASGG